jgi:hypothetical protein
LNEFYYQTDNLNFRKLYDQWVVEFYEKLQGIENKKKEDIEEPEILKSKIKLIPDDNLQTMSQLNIIKINKRKETKKSDSTISVVSKMYKKNKTEFKTTGLDFDDLIEPELPNDYVSEKHDDLITNLGDELMESLKRKSDIMSNDDYQILLALLRNKKEKTTERCPYYLDYSTKLDSIYRNEQDEVSGTEDKEKNLYINIESFVKKFIE